MAHVYDEYGQTESTYDEFGNYGQSGVIYDEYGESIVEDSQYPGENDHIDPRLYNDNNNRYEDNPAEFSADEHAHHEEDHERGRAIHAHYGEDLSDTQDEESQVPQFHPDPHATDGHVVNQGTHANKRQPTQASVEEASTLTNAMAGRCLIPEPVIQPRLTAKGCNYTPPLGRADVQRILGLTDYDWRAIRGLSRQLVSLHHLDVKDANGKTIRWPEKDPRNKDTARKKLESNFKVLSRCQSSWASDYFLQTHTNNKVKGNAGSQASNQSDRRGSVAAAQQPPATSAARHETGHTAIAQRPSVDERASSMSRSRAAPPVNTVSTRPPVSSVAGTRLPTSSHNTQPPASTVAGMRPPVSSTGTRPASLSESRSAPPSVVTSLNIPAQIRPRSTVSPSSRSPSPGIDATTAETATPLSAEEDNTDAAGPSQARKRTKTTKGKPKAPAKAPRAKKQAKQPTKAELAEMYEKVMRENRIMRATVILQEQAGPSSRSTLQPDSDYSSLSDRYSANESPTSSRTLSPVANRPQLPTPESTPSHGRNLGTGRARNSMPAPTDPVHKAADGVTRSGRATFKTPAKRQAEQEQANNTQDRLDQANRQSAKQNQVARRESLADSECDLSAEEMQRRVIQRIQDNRAAKATQSRLSAAAALDEAQSGSAAAIATAAPAGQSADAAAAAAVGDPDESQFVDEEL